MGEQELYRKFAGYYDIIYDWMDYSGESEFIKEIVPQHKLSEGIDLLDVACGTGGHIQYLKDSFQVVGVDINSEMLEIARKKVPDVEFIQGDMRTLDFEEEFDVVVCLFSAINYNITLSELKKTFESFRKVLKPGGVLFFDLGFCLENWDEGRMLVDAAVEGDLQLARISQSRLQNGIFNANFVFLIKKDGIMDFEVDQHRIGVFHTKKVINILEKLEMECYIYQGYQDQPWDPEQDERPVFVCVKS
ncbi:MAG TPA: class I SAM-dependent methyltransferase [Methanobacteriaceae archaeon]|nr:class I SAM-dependent methyltransferase [Methanobacteriaceae archaeon]